MTINPASEQQLDLVFHALSDTTRRSILNNVADRPMSISEIARPYTMSLAAVSKHIKVLERAQLVQRIQQGRTHHVLFKAEGLASAEAWMAHYHAFWNARLQSLEQFLQEKSQ